MIIANNLLALYRLKLLRWLQRYELLIINQRKDVYKRQPKTWSRNTGYTPEVGGSATAFGVDGGGYPMPVVYTLGFNLYDAANRFISVDDLSDAVI